MIHGALWYGDHPRNILSSRYQPQAPELIPAAEAEGHWLETSPSEIRQMKGIMQLY